MAAGSALQEAPLRGRREHRRQVTRRELLSAGRRLFAEKGLYDSRIEDLSRLAGIAKGTLYGYFRNKEELIEAVVTNGFSELLGHAHRAAQGARSREDAVARLVQAHLDFFEENPDLMAVFHQVRGLLKFDRGEMRALRDVLAKYLTGLAQILSLTPVSGSARRGGDTKSAMLLFGAISGITSVSATMTSWPHKPVVGRAVVRGLAAMLCSSEPAANFARRNTAVSEARRSRKVVKRVKANEPTPRANRRRR